MIRTATAQWQGTGKEGNGHLSTQSTVLNNTPYSFSTRFENGIGTNPEELIAAAHAGCFTMKLSFILSAANFIPQALITNCQITFENGAITQSKLILEAKVEGIAPAQFEAMVKDAETNCPVSKLLNTKIVVEFTLN
jgi:osmotically inducible protein OsmC